MKQNILLAHSARPGYPEQSYKKHVSEVIRRSVEFASEIARYTPCGDYFRNVVHAAASYHDLGKIDDANQKVLKGNALEHLPIDHRDAGTSYLLGKESIASALCVFSHHSVPPYGGLPSIPEENSKNYPFRVRNIVQNEQRTVREITDEKLNTYLKTHINELGSSHDLPAGVIPGSLFLRLALSCLVDADYSDTAYHYGNAVPDNPPKLRAKDRLELLDAHIKFLSKSNSDERTSLRTRIYESCRNTPLSSGICTCDSPVGTGKTTAVMAYLLNLAAQKALRHIFVVLPFTNIIDQSVETYRKSLVALGENAEDIVAAHHHKADYDDINTRQLAFLWEAPIVVTTAVQFFETLASNSPAVLRKLHQLPGSAIFIDESHAALPSHLWPQAWKWLQELKTNWGCYFVLGSGSLNRFWELEEFSDPPLAKPDIPELVKDDIRQEALKYENLRIRYKSHPPAMGLSELVQWTNTQKGPRLLVVNTVQSAAVIATEIVKQFGRKHVEHLSTSLCQRDRKITFDRVKKRLQDKVDTDWTLVATSCVEAGVDLSFRTAIRERCSLNSLIQVGGRINRNGEYTKANPEVWDVQLRYDSLLRPHPAFETSSRVLGELFLENRVAPQSCTIAMQREIRSKNVSTAKNDPIVKAEKAGKYPFVADEFKVIDTHTATAIIDQTLLNKIKNREKVDRDLFQKLTVQIWWHQKEKWALTPVEGYPGLYYWSLVYDDFLGYMAGVLQLEAINRQGWSTI